MSWPIRWVIVVLFVSVVGLAYFSYFYTNYRIHQQCDTINTVVAAAKATTPPTAFGKAIVKNYIDLKRNYHC